MNREKIKMNTSKKAIAASLSCILLLGVYADNALGAQVKCSGALFSKGMRISHLLNQELERMAKAARSQGEDSVLERLDQDLAASSNEVVDASKLDEIFDQLKIEKQEMIRRRDEAVTKLKTSKKELQRSLARSQAQLFMEDLERLGGDESKIQDLISHKIGSKVNALGLPLSEFTFIKFDELNKNVHAYWGTQHILKRLEGWPKFISRLIQESKGYTNKKSKCSALGVSCLLKANQLLGELRDSSKLLLEIQEEAESLRMMLSELKIQLAKRSLDPAATAVGRYIVNVVELLDVAATVQAISGNMEVYLLRTESLILREQESGKRAEALRQNIETQISKILVSLKANNDQ
jgi:hypothetical protein